MAKATAASTRRSKVSVSRRSKLSTSRAVSTHMEKNVRAIAQLERAAIQDRTPADRLSDAIAHVAGSMGFVLAHLVGFTVWIAINAGWVEAVPAFDPFPFSLLTLVVSLEAIFLSIFVLMSQNRAARLADRRAHLDLQVDLLAERELTVMLHMLKALCVKQGVVLDGVGTEVSDLLAETDVRELASNLDETLPA
jgi:uncharacterized membrane protein